MADEPIEGHDPAPGGPPRTPEQVVAHLEAALRRTPKTRPFERGVLRYNLGLAYIDMPTGSRELNLTRGVAALQDATRLFSPAVNPLEHARTQNALGIALRELRRPDEAAEAFQEAAGLIEPIVSPGEYGAAMNNLALALCDLGRQEEAVEPATKAVEAFAGPQFVQQRVLSLHTLGQALAATGDPERIRQAIERFEEALELADPQEYPFEWALVQHSLGAACTAVDEAARAAEAFRQALRVYTRTRYPFQYALTKNNLGLAHAQIGDAPSLRRAVVAYEDALRMLDLRVHKEQWEQVYRNLEMAERALADAGDPGTRAEHFARLAGSLDEDELRSLIRERLAEFMTTSEPRRTEVLAELDQAVLGLPDDQARKVSAAWIHVLMELPQDQFMAGLTARMQVHRTLDEEARARASDILEFCMTHELLAPQRVRVRDTLYELGYRRTEND